VESQTRLAGTVFWFLNGGTLNAIDQTLYVCLGKTGDILNLLPLLRQHWVEKKEKPAFLVASEFIGVLSGVSYVDPVEFTGNWMAISEAVREHGEKYRDLKVCQVAGFKLDQLVEAYERAGLKLGDPNTESFAKEAWRLAGKLQDWRLNLPLVFDNRDLSREEQLIEDLPPISKNKRLILINLGGNTSPYPYKDLLLDYLNAKLHKKYFQLLDISCLKAEQVYDLLGLYEKAHCLITLDTATLHLARAVPKLPVCALIQDSPKHWHGSPWSPQHAAHIRYHRPERIPDIYQAIYRIGKPGCRFSESTASVYHVWCGYGFTDLVRHRHKSARKTWEKVYSELGWKEVCIDSGAFGRDSYTQYEGPDSEAYPFLRDVLRAALLATKKDDDIIVLTRPDASIRWRWAVQFEEYEPLGWGTRWVADSEAEEGVPHADVDLFTFTAKWCRDNLSKLPDVIMGNDPYWHRLLKEYIRSTGGQESNSATFRPMGPPVSMINTAWRNINSKLGEAWFTEHGVTPEYYGASSLPRKLVINPEALFPFGYNPTQVRLNFSGNPQMLLAYRAHRFKDHRTDLAAATLDISGNVRTNAWIKHSIGSLSEFGTQPQSFEDPRLFWHERGLHMSFVVSNYPQTPFKSQVGYAKVSLSEEVEGVWELTSPVIFTRRQDMEKNWIFFDHGEDLYCWYSTYPKTVLWKITKNKVLKEWITDGVAWAWGTPRGGTQPLPHRESGKLVRLFHSRTINDFGDAPWRYHIGALLLEPSPPFKVIRMSKEPIMSGTAAPKPDACAHYKANVAFPSNWEIHTNGTAYRTAIGLNDCSCLLADLSPDQLKL